MRAKSVQKMLQKPVLKTGVHSRIWIRGDDKWITFIQNAALSTA